LLATLVALLAAALTRTVLLLLTGVLTAAALLAGLIALLILLARLLVLILVLRHLGFPLHKKQASPSWDTFACHKRNNCAVRSGRARNSDSRMPCRIVAVRL
jgi:fatty acid desaturase